MSHASGKVPAWSLNQEVIMIGDEAIGGNPNLVHFNDFLKKFDEDGVVLFVQKNRFPPSTD